MSKIQDLLNELEDNKTTVVEAPPEPQPVIEQPVEVEVPASKAGKKPEAPVEQVGGGRKLWLAGAGAVGIVLGFIGMMSYGDSRNMVIGFIAVVAFIGGGFAIYYGLKRQEAVLHIKTRKGKAPPLLANAICIYPDHIEFENIEDEDMLTFHPRRLRNDNKYYYVFIDGTAWGGEDHKLRQFLLPDTQYRDPREFANILNIPAHRKLAERRATMWEKISPLILVAAIGIVGFLFLVV